MERHQATTIITVNGFLGASSDFANIIQLTSNSKVNLISLNIKPSLYDFCFWDELVEKVSRDIKVIGDELTDQSIIMGYSMGGRLVLDLLQNDVLQRFEKVVFISSHMGLYTDHEIQQKNQFNQKCLEKIKTENTDSFLRYWNNLELFSNDKPITQSNWTKEDIEHYFHDWAHPIQRHMPLQLLEEQKLYYINGSMDLKYQKQAQSLKSEYPQAKLLQVSDRGHRLLAEDDLKHILNFILS